MHVGRARTSARVFPHFFNLLGAPGITVTPSVTAAWLEGLRQRRKPLQEPMHIEMMPTDLIEAIFRILFMAWPLATYLLRVSKAFAAVAEQTRGSLPPGEWWSGGPAVESPCDARQTYRCQT